MKTDIDPEGAGHWGATVLPGNLPGTNWGGSFLVIPEQSENKEAAWAFVKYMLATTEGQNTMFKAVDYFPAYEPAWEAAPELYTEGDPYFGGQAPNKIAAEIAANVPVVYNTIMDVTAEGYLYSSFNGAMMLTSTCVVLPLLIVFLCASKFFMDGLTAGAVKE